jgi:thiosulfate/3-mercaptopyruvate sulfurtransferase
MIEEPTSPLVSADELATRLHDPSLLLVDTRFYLTAPERGRSEYEAGHLQGAVYADLNRDLSAPVIPGQTGRHPLPDRAWCEQRFGELGIDSSDHVVVYDAQDGSIAARLWWMLRWLGHAKVSLLDGGFSAWSRADLPVTSQPSARRPGKFVARPSLVGTRSLQEIEEATRHQSLVLVDARAAERFRGEVEPIDRVAGHIPSASNLPFSELISEGKFRASNDLRSKLETVVEQAQGRPIVAYCGSGVTACELVLASAIAGLPPFDLYPGSYSEWIADGSRQVEQGPST